MSTSPDWAKEIQEYSVLIDAFVANEMSALEFEKKYLSAVKAEQRILPDKIFSVLQELFEDVDAYVSDPELRTEQEDLDEEQLHTCAVRAQGALRVLAP